MPHMPSDVRLKYSIHINKTVNIQLRNLKMINGLIQNNKASMFSSTYHLLIYTVMKYRKLPQWQPRITEAFSPHDEQNLIMLEFYEVGYFFKQK